MSPHQQCDSWECAVNYRCKDDTKGCEVFFFFRIRAQREKKGKKKQEGRKPWLTFFKKGSILFDIWQAHCSPPTSSITHRSQVCATIPLNISQPEPMSIALAAHWLAAPIKERQPQKETLSETRRWRRRKVRDLPRIKIKKKRVRAREKGEEEEEEEEELISKSFLIPATWPQHP